MRLIWSQILNLVLSCWLYLTASFMVLLFCPLPFVVASLFLGRKQEPEWGQDLNHAAPAVEWGSIVTVLLHTSDIICTPSKKNLQVRVDKSSCCIRECKARYLRLAQLREDTAVQDGKNVFALFLQISNVDAMYSKNYTGGKQPQCFFFFFYEWNWGVPVKRPRKNTGEASFRNKMRAR